MLISTGFEIDAPFDAVWDALLDLERVAPCLPGAQIEERVDDSTARGRFRVKLGPVTASYRGTLVIEGADRERGEVVLRGQATDTSAGGTAAVVIHNHVARADGGATSVRMDTDVKLTGRAAQLGGRASMMQAIADRMVGQFAAALREELDGSTPEESPGAVAAGAPAANAPPAGVPAASAAPVSASAGARSRESEPLDVRSLARDLLADNLLPVAGACVAIGAILGVTFERARRGRQ